MGASRRGVDMGPSAMRVAGLESRLEALGHQVTDAGNIRVEIAETQAAGADNARYLKQIADTCTRTADSVLKTLEEGMTPLVLGGDHSLAAGSVAGVAQFYRRQNQQIGVLWIDAHSDINTPDTSPRATCTACRWRRCSAWGRRCWATSTATRPRSPPKTRC